MVVLAKQAGRQKKQQQKIEIGRKNKLHQVSNKLRFNLWCSVARSMKRTLPVPATVVDGGDEVTGAAAVAVVENGRSKTASRYLAA